MKHNTVTLVPSVLFYLNKIGVKINTLNSILVILGIIIVTFALSRIFRKKNAPQKKEKTALKTQNKKLQISSSGIIMFI